jgi:hypothetical protein
MSEERSTKIAPSAFEPRFYSIVYIYLNKIPKTIFINVNTNFEVPFILFALIAYNIIERIQVI